MDIKKLEKELVKRKDEGWKIIRVVGFAKRPDGGEGKYIYALIEIPTHDTSENFIAKGKKVSSYIKNEFKIQGFCDKQIAEISFERVYTPDEERERENACCAEATVEPEPEQKPEEKGVLSLMKELESEKEKVRRLSEASITLMMCLVEVSKNFFTEDPVHKISLRKMISDTISNVAETLKPFRKGA